MEINNSKTEKKWQASWEKAKVFEVKVDSKKKKFYALEMYPYPSGSGLHIGHAFNYTIGDIIARFKRMLGFNVLHPMGFDSFGLPAENAAIKNKSHPKKYTEEAIVNFIKQQKALGLSYDWSRMVETHKPDYYKWDQWIFLKMFEKGLAFKKMSAVNWCPKCNTVLANEQVQGGKCWRHEDTDIEVKHLNQWFFKITDYADELYEGVDKLKNWPERIKAMQKNWIGKSYGTEIDFKISHGDYEDSDIGSWKVFTTRPDTIFGVTFLVVSAQHPKLMSLVTDEQEKEVKKFLKKVKTVSEKDLKNLDKEGVFTGSYAINPMTNEKVPIWVGNFVVADYGSGMVMAVPAHDQRDFEFAKKYGIEIKQVIFGGEIKDKAWTGKGMLSNSGKFDGMNSEEAKEKITAFLEKKKIGRKVVNFKLRDWLISRQRFWGTPIPIIYCDKCGAVPVPEKDLPVRLPEDIKFSSEKNPLVDNKDFVNCKCPKCGGKAKRETDTMDTFVNSSWYFFRYCDNKNSENIFEKSKADYWMPIDLYIGGAEHACMHLIYCRFYTKFLRDLGLTDVDEPTYNLFNQGMVHAEDGRKMSKSLGNVIDPLEMIDKYSADTLRTFLVSVASPDKNFAWNSIGIESMHKFLNRFCKFVLNVKKGKSSARVESKVNKTILEMTKLLEEMQYNLAIIKFRKLVEDISEEKEISVADLQSVVKLISPFCPHLSEELWSKLGNKNFLIDESWSVADEKKIDENLDKEEEMIEILAGDVNNVLKIVGEKEKVFVYCIPNEKEIFEKGKLVIQKRTGLRVEIFALNDKEKYDPEGKAKKAKPGKPAIYLE